MVVADVDAFKTLNDTHGHAHGDAVLRRVADALARAAGDGGLVGRIGGDEFAVLLDGRTERDGPGFAAEVDRALAITPVSVSMGWAALPTARSPAVALEAADLAMYARKHARLEPAWAVGLRQRAQAAVRRARVLRRRVIEVRGAARAGRG